jgi:beta-lactam-binding protein with PASTA domain
MKNVSHYLRSPAFLATWMIPFIAFLLGYAATRFFLQGKPLPTPALLGKSIHEAAQMLSTQGLSLRLLNERYVIDVAEGTVIEQLPTAGQAIKPNQAVFITIAAKKPVQIMPDWWGKRIADVLDTCKKEGFDLQLIKLVSDYPKGMCIAQYPAADTALTDKKIILYFSEGKATLALMPDLKKATLSQLEALLKNMDARAELFHTVPVADDHVCQRCLVVDQQPKAGALLDLARPISLQLQLEPAGP